MTTLPVTTEIIVDMASLAAAHERRMRAWFADLAEQMRLDAQFGRGTAHGPGRAELWEINRPHRVRRNIRRNLADSGWTKQPGRFVPASTSRLTDRMEYR